MGIDIGDLSVASLCLKATNNDIQMAISFCITNKPRMEKMAKGEATSRAEARSMAEGCKKMVSWDDMHISFESRFIF